MRMNIKFFRTFIVVCLVSLMASLTSAQAKYDYNWV
ncbi:MAG: hypothetical protein ACJATI_000502, partial [Halioglobus sp.]